MVAYYANPGDDPRNWRMNVHNLNPNMDFDGTWGDDYGPNAGGGGGSQMQQDAAAVRRGDMSVSAYAWIYGTPAPRSSYGAIRDALINGGSVILSGGAINTYYIYYGGTVLIDKSSGKVEEDANGHDQIRGANIIYQERFELNMILNLIAPQDQGGSGDLVSNSNGGPNWISTAGAVANIFGIGATISVSGSRPLYTGPKDWASQIKAGTKFGNRLGYLGLALTAYDMFVNGNWNTSNVLDFAFGTISFGGAPGALIAGSYFIGNTLTTGITGQDLGQHIDNNFIIITSGPLPFIPIPIK